ncbi:MAG TPA: hypothetical protein VN428_07390 [Bryobacteraceae bacterium]|nr:hypothetical protein [Bryobacteraceae bacterium]
MASPYNASPEAPSGSSGLKIGILFGAVIALLGFSIYLYTQLDKTQTEFTKFRKATLAELATLKEHSNVTTASNRKNLETLRDELEAARRQATMAVGQAKTEALKRAEQLNSQLAAEQQRQKVALTSQITEVKETATAATAGVSEVKGDVGTIRTDFAATKAELDKTIGELKQISGDMGVMSGLIATNGKELSALKQLGDRNYFDFNLKKTKAPQRIGDIAVVLKKADQKRNRYTVELIADDKKVEKKDKSINEPVQFYVSKARQPYELVVNEVHKDQIVGYLATPKLQASR